jgi:hypothetical protein
VRESLNHPFYSNESKKCPVLLTKGQKSKGRNQSVQRNGRPKGPGDDLMKARHGIVLQFTQKLGGIEVSNVGIGEHAGQNEGRGREGRGGALRAKDRRRQLRGVKATAGAVGAAHVPQSHGDGGIEHAANADQREGRQGRQVFQQTEGEQHDTGDAEEGIGAGHGVAGTGSEIDQCVGQDHTVTEITSEAVNETGKGNEGRPLLAHRHIPSVGVGFGIRALTDASHQAKGIGGQQPHDGNQRNGRHHGGRRIAKDRHAPGQRQHAGADNALDEIEDFVGNGGRAAAHRRASGGNIVRRTV